jgi:hypothetical protein
MSADDQEQLCIPRAVIPNQSFWRGLINPRWFNFKSSPVKSNMVIDPSQTCIDRVML